MKLAEPLRSERKSLRSSHTGQMELLAAEPEGLVQRPVAGLAYQQSRFSNRSILIRILPAEAEVL